MKLNMVPGFYTLNGSIDINKTRIKSSIYKLNSHNKLHRQKLRAKQLKKSDKTSEKESKTYEGGGF